VEGLIASCRPTLVKARVPPGTRAFFCRPISVYY
jgi:hypothetical protein